MIQAETYESVNKHKRPKKHSVVAQMDIVSKLEEALEETMLDIGIPQTLG